MPEYAAYKLIQNYRSKYGINSIDAIINRWAPDSENHTQKYIEFVAGRMDKYTWTPVFDAEMPHLLYHMAEFEGARGHFTFGQIERGMAAA